MEGWYRSFEGHMSLYHPSFLEFSLVLKNEESAVHVDILHETGGYVDPSQIARYVHYSTLIVRIVDNYCQGTNSIYLGNSS